MSGIAVESCGFGNLSLELHSADFGIFGASQTPSLVSAPKIPKNYESQTKNPSIVFHAIRALRESNINFVKINKGLRGSILDKKSGYGRYEQGNKTDSLLTKRVASLPDLSLKDKHA